MSEALLSLFASLKDSVAGMVFAHVPVVVDEHLEHGKSIHWLVHWHHVACFVHSEEVQVSVLAHATGGLVINVPVGILSSVELRFACPFGGSGPSLTTSPVANPV